MNTAVMFSSDDMTWETPPDLFGSLDTEFSFTLDVCATRATAKCAQFFTPSEDGLALPWYGACWMNPPYGREIKNWMRKAYAETRENARLCVCLVPARTDTDWWHTYAMHASEVRLLRGRVRFLVGGKELNSAPFPSALVIFRRGHDGPPAFLPYRKDTDGWHIVH